MTREEAINIMKVIVHMLEEKYDTDRVEDAVDMAIEALSAEPCEDCISRAEAIKAIEEYGSVWMEYTEEMSIHQIAERALKASKQSMYKILHDLPSIQPTTKENLAVPMSVIEDIKAEIETDLSMFCFDDWGNENGSWTAIKEIIDKHISERNDKE